MTLTREQVLTIGPIFLVATCYAIAAPSRGPSDAVSVHSVRDEAIDEPLADKPRRALCEDAAQKLRSQIHPHWNVLVCDPFVLAGDLTVSELEETYLQTIVPTVKALQVSYFNRPLRFPTTIVLCSSDERFRECNLQLDDADRSQYLGIYSRKHRRLIVNIASGEGTLAHELTHALAHADFPDMPEWFDEGLASLHEECTISSDDLHLFGGENWRNEVARDALDRGELRLLEDVTSKRFGLRDRANVDYACVRTLCLYLQERGLLEEYYRVCREEASNDPTGLRTLCRVTNSPDPRTLDDAFRAWLLAHKSNGPI